MLRRSPFCRRRSNYWGTRRDTDIDGRGVGVGGASVAIGDDTVEGPGQGRARASRAAMELSMDVVSVRCKLLEAIKLRSKYTPVCISRLETEAISNLLGKEEKVRWEFRDGIMHVSRVSDTASIFEPLPTLNEFYDDMKRLFQIRTDGAVSTFSYHRLKLLEMKFDLYHMVNFDIESAEQNDNGHRDFYNVRKVDTHIHHSASMNGKHLLRFIKKKLKKFPNDVVCTERGMPVTLGEVCERLAIKAEDLSLDRLNVMADKTTMHRFDRFNSKYSPLGNPMLRTIFLKTDNEMGGRYLAEITRELLDDLEESKYQHTEWRLSIYGRDRKEWPKLASWVVKNRLMSTNNMWMIQVPRLYSVYKSAGSITCFQDMLDNIFMPLYEATEDPEAHPEVHEFLKGVSGFDTVDDESKSEIPVDRTFSSKERAPARWDIHDNPSYKYYNFYLQSNVRTLNRLRAARGLSQFNYRPHAGEAGETHHLDTAFLLSDGIAHGINLRKSLGLQYLYYLCEIPLAQSPCSNNQLFLSYEKHPFHEFYRRGLHVSLSTDDPLMFHQTKEPLMEEYSIAKQIWRLTSADLCELARNSVLQSGFPADVKEQWLGTSRYMEENDMQRTNVPNIRHYFRRRCHEDEMRLLQCEDGVMDALRSGICLSPRTLGVKPSPVLELTTMQRLPQPERPEELQMLPPTSPVAEAMVQMDEDCASFAALPLPARTLGSRKRQAEGQADGADGAEGAISLRNLRRFITDEASVAASDGTLAAETAAFEGRQEWLAGGLDAKASAPGGHDGGSLSPLSCFKAFPDGASGLRPGEVMHAFGETGLLGKLLAQHSYRVVFHLAAYLCECNRLFGEPFEGQSGAAELFALPDVYSAWRLAILNTREYQQVCEQCFGRFVHYCTPEADATALSGTAAAADDTTIYPVPAAVAAA